MRDWNDVLPKQWAMKQASYERRKFIQRMRRDTGMTYKEIGKKAGVSGGRVRQILLMGERQSIPPIETYFKEIDDLSEIANWGKPEKAKVSLLKERKVLMGK